MTIADGWLILEMRNGSDWVCRLGFDNGFYWANSVAGKRPLARGSYALIALLGLTNS